MHTLLLLLLLLLARAPSVAPALKESVPTLPL